MLTASFWFFGWLLYIYSLTLSLSLSLSLTGNCVVSISMQGDTSPFRCEQLAKGTLWVHERTNCTLLLPYSLCYFFGLSLSLSFSLPLSRLMNVHRSGLVSLQVFPASLRLLWPVLFSFHASQLSSFDLLSLKLTNKWQVRERKRIVECSSSKLQRVMKTLPSSFSELEFPF